MNLFFKERKKICRKKKETNKVIINEMTTKSKETEMIFIL